MDEDLTDYDLLASLIADVALDVLSHLGDDPKARYAYFRAFIDLSRRTVERQQN